MKLSCFSFFFFKQKTAYEMRISDWSSDVCSSDLSRAPTMPDQFRKPMPFAAFASQEFDSTMSARPRFGNEPRSDSRIAQLRVPPQSVEAEQAVLGGLMLAPDAYDRIADHLVDGDFYRRDPQLIYRAIRGLAETNIGRQDGRERRGKYVVVMGEAESIKK